MGTGSVDGGHCRGDSYCRRCLSPFSAATLGHVEKVEKGDRHRAGGISCGFGIYPSSEPVPLFH